MSGKFVFDFNEQKKAAAKAADSKTSGGSKIMDLKKEQNAVLVLPPTVAGAPLFFETIVHEVWANKKPIAKAASPTFVGEEDEVMLLGWKYKDKFKDSKNEKLKNLWKIFMPKKNTHVNVIDKADIPGGPKLLKTPSAVLNILLDELNEAESTEDMKAICDLDQGRWLVIKHNGGTGLNKEYLAKFAKTTAKLVESELVDADKIAAAIRDLRKLQPAQDPAALKKVAKLLVDQANYIINKEGGSIEDEDLADVEFEDQSNEDVKLDSVKGKAGKNKAEVAKEAEEADYELDLDVE